MATYAYKCADCGNAFEIKAAIREKEEGKSEKFVCPKCRSKNIRPEFSAANFIKNIFKAYGKTDDCCCDKNIGSEDCRVNETKNNNTSHSGKNDGCGCCG
ncbi:MAG: zinc ribbon domain-containing protein [Patescibacteria group bacterium]|nr:zinc ribbon domain-containing protein [Patescibacteria group bacterium]